MEQTDLRLGGREILFRLLPLDLESVYTSHVLIHTLQNELTNIILYKTYINYSFFINTGYYYMKRLLFIRQMCQ